MKFVALALLPALLCGCGSKQPDTAVERRDAPRTVRVTRIGSTGLGAGLTVSGRLVAREEAAVASQLTGYQVSRVLVDLGALVRAGQPLAILDDTLLRADVAQQRASVAEASVAAERAAAEAQRVASLEKTGVLSDEAIAERKLGARSATAQLAQARERLAAQSVRERLMTVRAPVGGRILSRSVRPGDVASPSNVMFTIATDQVVELDAEVPEQALGLVHVGQSATVTLSGGGTIQGRIRLVSSQIDPDTRLGRARVTLPVRPDLRPGGYAQATFATTSAPVSTVPDAAVTYSADGPSIMIVDRQRRVSQVPVHIGRRGGGRVELIDGPAPGTMVLVGSQDFVLPGDVVRPVAAAVGGDAR